VSRGEGEVRRGFGSDNHAGVHPEVLEAVAAANVGHADAYGADRWTARLGEAVRRHFGEDAVALPVFNGTGANVLCLELLGRPQEAVICTSDAHINVDECGAPERITGMKLLTVETEHGKLEPADLDRWESRRGDEHHVQPRIVSISESTELGTVYTPEEIGSIADAAHRKGMYLHVDGARLANAAAALGVPLSALTTAAGVDAVSFGGTKNGLMFGELAVFGGEIGPGPIPFARKQLMQLASKMRFLSAQFEALLGAGDLWLRSATHANRMAARLAARIEAIDGVEAVHPVEANGVFARMPTPAITHLHERLPGEHPFHVWDESEGVVRWMCSWDTTEADVDDLAVEVAAALAASP
jgi:threonine aldolase